MHKYKLLIIIDRIKWCCLIKKLFCFEAQNLLRCSGGRSWKKSKSSNTTESKYSRLRIKTQIHIVVFDGKNLVGVFGSFGISTLKF